MFVASHCKQPNEIPGQLAKEDHLVLPDAFSFLKEEEVKVFTMPLLSTLSYDSNAGNLFQIACHCTLVNVFLRFHESSQST